MIAFAVIIDRHGQREHSRYALVEDAQRIARFLVDHHRQRCWVRRVFTWQ